MHAASITVTNTNDNAPGSLRQALTIANDGDTIKFEVTDTITLTSGGLPINKNITISGAGRDQLSIDGNQAIIVFGVFPGRAPTMSGLTVGLCNYGVAAVSSCVLTGNLLGLYSYEGETIVRNCVVSGNSAPSAGGIDNGGDAELSNTILNAGASGENIFNNGGTVTSHTYNISSDMPTQPPVQKRSCTTRPAPSTRPLAQGRLIATPVATITGRSGTVRFGTPYALET